MTPLEMIEEWRKGCSVSLTVALEERRAHADQLSLDDLQELQREHPEDCPHCTRALIDHLERKLREPPERPRLLRNALEAVRKLKPDSW